MRLSGCDRKGDHITIAGGGEREYVRSFLGRWLLPRMSADPMTNTSPAGCLRGPRRGVRRIRCVESSRQGNRQWRASRVLWAAATQGVMPSPPKAN